MNPIHNQILKTVATGSLLTAFGLSANADLTHRYSFTSDASDSVGSANGTTHGTTGGGITFSSGQLQLNNPNFSGTSSSQNYLSLPVSIIPTSGSMTIEEWFTFTGSGFFTEAFTLTDSSSDANPPNSGFGQYIMGTISAPQGGPNAGSAGGSHIGQTLAGYGNETDAFETTPGLGAGGGGYLDDGGTYMMALVIDGVAGTFSYYLNGSLQQTITAIPLSSYSFTDVYLGRSAFPGDNSTSGSIDEFRVYNNAQSASAIAADYGAGPNTVIAVPEPSMLGLSGLGGLALLFLRQRSKR